MVWTEIKLSKITRTRKVTEKREEKAERKYDVIGNCPI